jgi:hypothetical protein
MKKTLFVIGLAIVASITSYAAQPFSVGAGSTATATFGTTNFLAIDDTGSYALAGYPIGGVPTQVQNTPIITYLNAQSDLATSKLTLWYSAGNPQAAINTNTTTSLVLNGTNGIVAGLPVVIAHTTGICEPRIASSISTTPVVSTNTYYPYATVTNYTYTVVVNAAPTYTVNIGDQVTGYAQQALINWGASTNSLNGYGAPLLAGQYQVPMLVSLNYTSAGGFNIVSGIFQ